MKQFIHDSSLLDEDKHIYMENEDGDILEYALAEFLHDVPTYPGLPQGIIKRVWSETDHYLEDEDGMFTTDGLTQCPEYLQHLLTYKNAYAKRSTPNIVYAIVNLDKQYVKCDNTDKIVVTAKIAATNAYDASPLDLDLARPIFLKHYHNTTPDGLIDTLFANFVSGEATVEYTYNIELHGLTGIGRWVLDPDTFDMIAVGATMYKIELAPFIAGNMYDEQDALEFFVYRV